MLVFGASWSDFKKWTHRPGDRAETTEPLLCSSMLRVGFWLNLSDESLDQIHTINQTWSNQAFDPAKRDEGPTNLGLILKILVSTSFDFILKCAYFNGSEKESDILQPQTKVQVVEINVQRLTCQKIVDEQNLQSLVDFTQSYRVCCATIWPHDRKF